MRARPLLGVIVFASAVVVVVGIAAWRDAGEQPLRAISSPIPVPELPK